MMHQYVKWFIVALVLALALPVMAGEKGKCTMDTQTCLDKYAAKLKHKGWVGIELDKDLAVASQRCFTRQGPARD